MGLSLHWETEPGIDVVVLAAGKGSRMHSNLPKVLHQVAGVPILARVLEAARGLNPCHLLVIYNDERLLQNIEGSDICWVRQEERLGTGHATHLALQYLADHGELKRKILVLCADLPLLETVSLREFCELSDTQDIAVCSFWAEQPRGFGRIIRDRDRHLMAIVEEADADVDQRQIHEVNSGVIIAKERLLERLLPTLKANNRQKEYYLTDTIAAALAMGAQAECFMSAHAEDFLGVNDAVQLASAERMLQRRRARRLQLEAGVQFLDPSRFDLRGELIVGRDVVIDVDVVLEGQVSLGSNVRIGPFCHLKDVTVEDNVTILAHSVIEGARLTSGCQVGPFARVRPGSVIGKEAKIGNFVEIKNSNIGSGSKVSHLSYIGDTDMGDRVNIGAGTITCNYDGYHKYRTTIGDGSFIGSNSALVAPVSLGAQVTVGAGSTIVSDVLPHQLALARARQVVVDGWEPKAKRKPDK